MLNGVLKSLKMGLIKTQTGPQTMDQMWTTLLKYGPNTDQITQTTEHKRTTARTMKVQRRPHYEYCITENLAVAEGTVFLLYYFIIIIVIMMILHNNYIT